MESNTILYWADCREILSRMDDNSVDTAFLDPQYGTGNLANKTPKYDQSAYMASRRWDAFHAAWDAKPDSLFIYQWLYELRRVLKPRGSAWICGTFHNIPTTAKLAEQIGFYTIQWCQWIIPNAMPHLAGMKMANCNQTLLWLRKDESPAHRYNYQRAKAWNKGKNLRDFWQLTYTEEEWEQFFLGLHESWVVVNNSAHAAHEMPALTQFKAKKPYALVARCLDLTLPDDAPSVALDCFAGSGTTGAVCQRINTFVPIPREYPIQCVLVEKSKANIDQFITPRLNVQAIVGPGGGD